MPGKVGALQTPEVSPRLEMNAVDRAFTLVAGWNSKDKNAITAALEDLKVTAENNEAVYAQASEALQQLSRERANVEASAKEAAQRLADAETAEMQNVTAFEEQSRDIASASGQLERDQEAFKLEKSRRVSEMDTRKKELDERERQIEDQRKKNEAASTALLEREKAVQERERNVAGVATDLRSVLQRLDD